MKKAILVMSFLYCLLFAPCSVFPLTIEGHFIGGVQAGTCFGGGNIEDIFRAAASRWEAVIHDDFTLRIDYGWGGETLGGNHWLISQGGTPSRETYGVILVNPQRYNDGTLTLLYMDPTPGIDEEFTSYSEATSNLGNGKINSSRMYAETTLGDVRDAAGGGWTDLESVFIHEIGHALGLSMFSSTFEAIAASGHININGNVIPLQTNYSGYTAHIDVTGVLMASLAVNQRSLPSDVDILAIAAMEGFTKYDVRSASAVSQEPPPRSSSHDSSLQKSYLPTP